MNGKQRHSDLEEFVSEFEALGYSRWSPYDYASSEDILYRYGVLSADTFHAAYLRFQPRARSFAITLGAFNWRQLEILEFMGPIISKYMFRSEHVRDFGISNIIKGSLYIPARGRYLNLLKIPNPVSRGEWREQLELIRVSFLKELFWTIDSPEKLMTTLLRDDFPFEWVVVPPILRAGEVVALAHVLGWSINQIKETLAPFKPLLEKRMILSNDFDVMIDEFIASARKHIKQERLSL